MKSKQIIIYRDLLLPPSETFVIGQGEALQEFTPYYVGSRFHPNGLSLPMDRTLVVNRGGIIGRFNEVLYKFWGIAPSFYQRLQKLSPFLIHAHFGPGGALALRLKEILKIPLIVTFHGFDATMKDEFAQKSFYGHRLYLRTRELVKKKVDLFLAVSSFIRDQLISQGFPEDKIFVHYVGVDTDFFQPNPKIHRKPIVLFVGRLVEVKGCSYLIHAMGQVQAKNPEISLVVIGDGPLKRSLTKLAKQTLVSYQFLGTQPLNKVRDWMNQARVFCVPSIQASTGATEGFGLVFAEAQAMELPVVSFRTGGVSEAVSHGETGFLASEGNIEELARYILLLMEQKELWKKFSKEARIRVQKLFSRKNQTKILEKLYHDVLPKE